MLKKEDFSKVGVIKKPRGISGELNFALLPKIELNEQRFSFLFLEIDGYLVPFKTEEMFWVDETSGTIKFEDIDSNENAAKITGNSFFLPTIEICVMDEFTSLSFFIGFNMIDQNRETVGKITDFMDIPGNPILVITKDGKEVLVPFNEELLIDIDKTKYLIAYKIPHGLLE